MTIGCLDELDIKKDYYDCYVERMEQFFMVNDVPNVKKEELVKLLAERNEDQI